ncbi:retrovirus-related Pol polyprotein from transposon 297 [Trichonephila clavipes]|nr:retrovirus-related Pol polyprotein from transposon 297 [Trichonephila clavipes]
MLIFVITQRLDDESRKQYEMELHSNDLPKWNNFLDFLIKRSQALENVQRNSSLKNKNEYSPKFRSFVVKSNGKTCPLCPSETHPILSVKCFTRCLFKKEATKLEWSLHFKAIGIKAESSCDPDDQAIQDFKSSVRFNSGRYEVGFPWNSHTQELNDNFSVAEKRVKSLTRRFIRDPTLYIQYSEILKEYESQGIIERVLETKKPTDRAVFYLPHQAVFRQEILTTKIRIVFDASSHEDGQPSLNDCIWSGGNLNPNIFHLIISFRLNTIAITADIERAFLQISLRDEDRDAVRFLFPDIRSNQTDPYKFQVYRFKRVMFGVNVSPFLLSATIKHHIENYREQYPAATEMLDTCLYVDDVISGADDISQALKVSKDAETIMKNASMKLRKWNSNDQTLMRTWEKEGLETHPRHPDDSSKIPSSKILGIPWDVVHDYFTIDVKGLLQLDTSKPITKRIVLQSAGKIYDPVGFLSPYTIRLKCLLQELWLRKLSWEDELPPDIHAVWSQWWLELPFLSELKIPRKILDSSGDSSEVQIHTFSDASQKAYGAAAFLRVKHKGRVSVDLVTSKSRVEPLKRLSLPRLELMGALLAARLAKEVKKILDQKVREIQSLTDPNSWFHCSGKDNPADLLTRGISVDALTTNSKWCNGSSFLRQIDFQTKGLDEAIPERVYLTEMRKNSNPKEDISLTLTVTKNNFLDNIIDISNNYVKLIRVEVSHAENWLIHSLHEREFYEEMRKLLAGTLVLIKDENLPSTKWSTGRITEIFPGTDAATDRSILASITPITVKKAAEVADRILEVSTPTVSLSTNAIASFSENRILQEIERLHKRIDDLTMEERRTPERRNSSRPRNRSRNRSFSRARESCCWYHKKFQERAKKCIPPCSYKEKNESSEEKLIDNATKISTNCKLVSPEVHSIKLVSGESIFHGVLREFTEIVKPPSFSQEVKHNIKHFIETSGAPVFAKARRLADDRLKIAKYEFQHMLNLGHVRPSKCNYASPLHIVPKMILMIGDQAAWQKYFSHIDLADDQIPINEEDIHKTAIITPFGLYESTRMQFGLCNAASTFQHFVDEVLRGLNFVYAFIDEILVASSSEAEHIKHLRLLFQRLDQYGLCKPF